MMNDEQSTTVMSFLIGTGCSVSESKLEKSSGHKNLDRAALKGLSACKFKAGTKDGASPDLDQDRLRLETRLSVIPAQPVTLAGCRFTLPVALAWRVPGRPTR
jgi:TonB family protein